jgi:hypothetical protein
MVNVTAFRLDWINSIGGFDQPYAYYGGLECRLSSKFNGLKLAFLTDFPDAILHGSQEFMDKEYRLWKNAHLGGFTGSFKEWLVVNKSI